MRNCFTKVTNVFRKSKHLKNACDAGDQNEDVLKHHQHCVGDGEDDVHVTAVAIWTDSISMVKIGSATNYPSSTDTKQEETKVAVVGANDKSQLKMICGSYYKDNAADSSGSYTRQTQSVRVPDNAALSHTTQTSARQQSFRSFKNIRKRLNIGSKTKPKENQSKSVCEKEYDNKNEKEKKIEIMSAMANDNVISNLITTDNRKSQQAPAIITHSNCPTTYSHKVTKSNVCPSAYVVVSTANSPEDNEYDDKEDAERQDVMTPLPANVKHHSLIADTELVTLQNNNHKIKESHSEYKNNLQRQGRGSNHVIFRDLKDDMTDYCIDGVILRKKFAQSSDRLASASGLYERRQPLCPKLRLMLECKKGERSETTHSTALGNDRDYSSKERNLCDVKLPSILPPNPQLKALFVFHKMDNFCEAMQQACQRQLVELTLSKTKGGTSETLCSTTESFQIIIIDARSPKQLDAEHIARTIRNMNGHNFSTIIAVVRKSSFEREEVINALLDAGVNRCIAECTNVSVCSTELKQILHSIVRPHNVISTQQSIDAHTEECFFEKIEGGNKFSVTIEVIDGGFLDIDIKVTAPAQSIMHQSVKESSSRLTFAAVTTGVYSVCFDNSQSSMTPKMVMFSIDVGESPHRAPGAPAEDEVGHTKLEDMIRELSSTLTSVKHEQQYMRGVN